MLQMVKDEDLRDAMLDGMACRATAWADVTRLEVVRKGEARPVDGVRTWRGVAVLENAMPRIVAGWSNRPIPYQGPIRVGDEEHDIQADVFITSHRRNRRSSTAGSASKGDAGSTYFIEFTGAGNL